MPWSNLLLSKWFPFIEAVDRACHGSSTAKSGYPLTSAVRRASSCLSGVQRIGFSGILDRSTIKSRHDLVIIY
jgi:hypothetical protein